MKTQEIIVPIIIVCFLIISSLSFYILKQKKLIIKDINFFIIDYKNKENKIPNIYSFKENKLPDTYYFLINDSNKNIEFKIEENENFYIIKNFINDFVEICLPLTNTTKIDDLSVICKDKDIYILKDYIYYNFNFI